MRSFMNILSWNGYFFIRTFFIIMLMASLVQGGDVPPEEMLEMAREVSDQASQIAIKAKEVKDYYQAQRAFALASEAVPLTFEVFGMAKKMSNQKLLAEARDVLKRIHTAILLSQSAARQIADLDLEPDVAHAVNFLLESCEFLLVQLDSPPE